MFVIKPPVTTVSPVASSDINYGCNIGCKPNSN